MDKTSNKLAKRFWLQTAGFLLALSSVVLFFVPNLVPLGFATTAGCLFLNALADNLK